jgi:hypothetical protein
MLWDTIQFLQEPEANTPSKDDFPSGKQVPTFANAGEYSHPNAGLTDQMNRDGSHFQEAPEREDFSPHVFLITGWGAPGTTSGLSSAMGYGGGMGLTGLEPPDPTCRVWTCWCAIHRAPSTPYPVQGASDAAGNVSKGKNLIIMEFELERDSVNPLYPPPETMPMLGNGPVIGSAGSRCVQQGKLPTLEFDHIIVLLVPAAQVLEVLASVAEVAAALPVVSVQDLEVGPVDQIAPLCSSQIHPHQRP